MPDVDLHPMTLGELLDRTFTLYKKHFWLFVGIMALPFLILFFFRIGLVLLIQAFGTMSRTQPGGFAVGAVSAGVATGLAVYVIYMILIGAAQAATIFAVSELYLGREATVRGSYRRVRGKVGRVLLVMFLVGLLVMVGAILLIIPGIILACRTAVAVPAAMLEDLPAGQSIQRSMRLTKGHALQSAGIFLLVIVFSGVVEVAFGVPMGFLTHGARPLTLSFGVMVLQQLSGFFSQVLAGPIGTIAFSLLYYNLRVRKEAFDLQHLMASLGPAAEAGAPSVA